MTQFNDRVTIYQYMDTPKNRESKAELKGKSSKTGFLTDAADWNCEINEKKYSKHEFNDSQKTSQRCMLRCGFVCQTWSVRHEAAYEFDLISEDSETNLLLVKRMSLVSKVLNQN